MSEKKAEQRRLQREEQKRVKEGRRTSRGNSGNSQAGGSSSPGGRIVDKLLGTIRDGFSSRKSPESVIGDSTDSDYGSRPASPGPEEDIGSGLQRGTPMRKSWQKFDQLNSITENRTSEAQKGVVPVENEDTRSVSSGVSSQGTWGSTGSREDTSPSNTMNSSNKKARSQQRPRSADDDSLFDMLLQGNDEEALEKLEYFKREGSIRRSGRRSSRRHLASMDSRERTDSPTSSPMITRRNKSFCDQTDGVSRVEVTSPETDQKPATTGSPQRYRSVSDSQEDKLALGTMARRERFNDSVDKDSVTSASPAESPTKNPLVSSVVKFTRSHSDRGFRRTRRDYSVPDSTADKKDHTDSSSAGNDKSDSTLSRDYESNSSTSPVFKHEGDSPIVDATSTTSPKSRNRANGRRNSEELNNDRVFTDNHRLESGDTSLILDRTSSDVPETVKGEEVSVEEKVTNWQNKLQHVDVEAALDTVETSLGDRERRNREHTISKSMDAAPNQTESSPSRPRYRRWRTVDGELDTARSRADRTERRKAKEIYDDHESSVFLDRPINAHLALEGMPTDVLTISYREKIKEDRRAIEEIMAVDLVREEKPRGLKAIQLMRTQSTPPGNNNHLSVDDDPWASIDRQQIEIRRDIIDMKIRATTPERESHPLNIVDLDTNTGKGSPSTGQSSQNSSAKESDSNKVYRIADDDVYILRENTASKRDTNSTKISAKKALSNRTSAKTSPVVDVNDNTIPLSKAPQKNVTPKKTVGKVNSLREPLKSKSGPEMRKPRDLNSLAKPGVAKPASRVERSNSTSSSSSRNNGISRSLGSSLSHPGDAVSKSGTLNRNVTMTKKSSRQRTDSGGSASSADTRSEHTEGRHRRGSTSSTLSSVSSSGTLNGSSKGKGATYGKPRADSGSSATSRSSVNSTRRLTSSKSSNSSLKSTSSTASATNPTASKLKSNKPSSPLAENGSSRSQPFNRNAPGRKTLPARPITGSISNRGGHLRSSIGQSTTRTVDRKPLSNVASSPAVSGSKPTKKTTASSNPNLQRPSSLSLTGSGRTNRTTGKSIREQLHSDTMAKRDLKDFDPDDTSSMSSLGDALDKEKTEKKRSPRVRAQNNATVNSSRPSTFTRNGSVRKSVNSPRTPTPRSASTKTLTANASPKSTPRASASPRTPSRITTPRFPTSDVAPRISTPESTRKSSPRVQTHSPKSQRTRPEGNTNRLQKNKTVPANGNGRVKSSPPTVASQSKRNKKAAPIVEEEARNVLVDSESDFEGSQDSAPDSKSRSQLVAKGRYSKMGLVRSTSDPDLLKSIAMSVSDSNLQKGPDTKSSLQRASTMSLPPDARKRGPPDSLKSTRVAKPSRLSKFINKFSRKGEKKPDSIAETFEEFSDEDGFDLIADDKSSRQSVNRSKVQKKPVVTSNRSRVGSNLTAPTAASLRRSKSAASSSQGFRPKFGFGSGRFDKSTTSANGTKKPSTRSTSQK